MPDEFENMTWANYQRLLIHKSFSEANEWDKTRVLMSYILNTQVEKKHQKKPKEILPLWIDKYVVKQKSKQLKNNIKGKILSKEEREKLAKLKDTK